MRKIVTIDPPEGWKYGFPRVLPEEMHEVFGEKLTQWLVDNGYPQSELDYWKGAPPCGVSTQIIEDDDYTERELRIMKILREEVKMYKDSYNQSQQHLYEMGKKYSDLKMKIKRVLADL